MKKLFIICILLTISLFTNATHLFLYPTGSFEQTKNTFSIKDITVHFYNDDFIIGTTEGNLPYNSVQLDEQAWSDPGMNYFILYFDQDSKDEYIKEVAGNSKVLYTGNDFLIASADENQASRLYPSVHGGIIRIGKNKAKLPGDGFRYEAGTVQPRDYIAELINLVSADTLEALVQHLQDFGTRNAYKAGGIQAQNWIKSKFESYGLETELHDFYMPGGAASDNVIATLTGVLHPEEYVVLGAHYDSYTGGSNEPGADDNATGTAGILEAARILSQYQFDRTIIFATWSGEEYGLYGSEAWASEAADNGMNILGYFNIDMAGYLYEPEGIHTDIIAPGSANELRQFYKDVCAIYLPDFPTFNGALSGGDSDHTSFNNAGYQGIFPFEDSQHYSPYIHTANDLIGPSVNSFEQHMTFVKAIVANVVSLSDQLPYPENLTAQSGDQQVSLSWDAVEGAGYYNIYRNGDSEPCAAPAGTSFTDFDVENMTEYTYYVTAFFTGSQEESGPSNTVSVIPMPPIALPFYDDFETGGLYWAKEGTWGLQDGVYHSSSNSLTESPLGEYAANTDASATLMPLDLTGAVSAQLSFWTKYDIESGWDFMYLEVSVGGLDWEQLDSYSGLINDWALMSYSLTDYVEQSDVILRFRFSSDGYVEGQGMDIDDVEIMISGIGVDEGKIPAAKTDFRFDPNPASTSLNLNFRLETGGMTKISLTDQNGIVVKTLVNTWQSEGDHSLGIDVSDLPAGLYYGKMEAQGRKTTQKIVITN
jgi:hypothetical protein